MVNPIRHYWVLKFFLLVIALEGVGCQEHQQQKTDSLPQTVENQITESNLPLLYPDSQNSELDYPLLVLGWSPKGHIAYLERQAREASDEDYYHFVVQDLKSDSQLVHEKFVFRDYRDFPQALIEKEEIIQEAMSTHGILEHKTTISLFPALFGEFREFYVSATITTEKGVSPHLGFEGIASCDVSLTQNGKQRKRIDRRRFGDYPPLDISVSGYLKSPHEDRIAVLMCRVLRGWEGPPNTRRFYLIGAGVGENF